MNLNASQKETVKRKTAAYLKGDPEAHAFFERLQPPYREPFLAERTRLIGTVQHNEFGLPDEPLLNTNQMQSIIKNTRLMLEGNDSGRIFIEKIRVQADAGRAYAQAMMRVHAALFEKLKEQIASEGIVSVKSQAQSVKAVVSKLTDLATIPALEDPAVNEIAAECTALLSEFTPSIEHSMFTKSFEMFKGLQTRNPEAIKLAGKVFSRLFMT